MVTLDPIILPHWSPCHMQEGMMYLQGLWLMGWSVSVWNWLQIATVYTSMPLCVCVCACVYVRESALHLLYFKGNFISQVLVPTLVGCPQAMMQSQLMLGRIWETVCCLTLQCSLPNLVQHTSSLQEAKPSFAGGALVMPKNICLLGRLGVCQVTATEANGCSVCVEYK